ncbi:unnamed protein product [Prorocentrum cordatum]|uniref:Ammonium transporter AmtB-like domain-containing protein n=1 Tax=Prorocentrum cordatum TaxID=2364126 RepID=A0ABN9TMA7_9DINO|nr:unnamed protein product [Polarella glacialis]
MAGRIISMQTGFAMLESAFARPMNSANIMMKNLFDLFLGALAFYCFGYEVAFGEQSQLVGDSQFDFALWFIHFSYATTAATITSGALSGRVAFMPYLLLSIVTTGIIYPVVVRWTWGGGWLGEWGFVDFAGSAVVHMVGAVSALVAVCKCGPRIGKYPQYRPWKGLSRKVWVEHNKPDYYEMPMVSAERAIYSRIKMVNNPTQLLFGIFLLITGFLAFNPASTFSTTASSDLVAAKSTVVTLLSASGGSLACFAASLVRTRTLIVSVPDLTTAVLGSMVASCACCDVVSPLVGVGVGFVAACLALWCQWWLNEHQIDDVVGAVAAHGPPGIWGVVSVSLWAQPGCHSSLRGLAFGGGTQALKHLGIQVTGIVALIGFVAVATYLTVVSIDVMIGFRSSRASELIGLDFMEHRFDDGSFGTDPNKVTVISESAMRDCLARRVVRNLSPMKSYITYHSPSKHNHSPSKTHEHNHATSKASEHGQSADKIPPKAPAAEPVADHTLERIPDEPGTGQPSVAPAAGARSSTSEVLDSSNLASEEALAHEVAALRATVAALGEQLSILRAAAGAAPRRPSESGAFGGVGEFAEMSRMASLRDMFAEASSQR